MRQVQLELLGLLELPVRRAPQVLQVRLVLRARLVLRVPQVLQGLLEQLELLVLQE